VTQAYPLHWPFGMPRTERKAKSGFRSELSTAANNIVQSLRLFGKDSDKPVENLIVSSNVTLMTSRPRDGGVAVYFRWLGMDCCIAVDRYATPAENLQAIVHIVEAERTKLRHGGLNIVRASFRGFTALPPPKGPDGQLARPWWDALGLPEGTRDMATIETRYRELVKAHHPDRGGDAGTFNAIADAIRQAREELKA